MVGAGAAVGAPLVMWFEFLYWGSSTPGYNLLLRAASDLGRIGAPHRLQFTAGFFYLAGVLTVLVALAMWRLLPAGWASAAAAALIAVEGLVLVAAGVLPESPASAAQSSQHQLAASFSFLAATAAPIAVGIAAHRRLPRMSRVSLVLGGLLLALFAADYPRRTLTRLPDGVFQRPFGVLLTAWFLLLAVMLRRLGKRPERQPGSGRG